jgi:hypothetical protein
MYKKRQSAAHDGSVDVDEAFESRVPLAPVSHGIIWPTWPRSLITIFGKQKVAQLPPSAFHSSRPRLGGGCDDAMLTVGIATASGCGDCVGNTVCPFVRCSFPGLRNREPEKDKLCLPLIVPPLQPIKDLVSVRVDYKQAPPPVFQEDGALCARNIGVNGSAELNAFDSPGIQMSSYVLHFPEPKAA